MLPASLREEGVPEGAAGKRGCWRIPPRRAMLISRSPSRQASGFDLRVNLAILCACLKNMHLRKAGGFVYVSVYNKVCHRIQYSALSAVLICEGTSRAPARFCFAEFKNEAQLARPPTDP